MPPKKMNKTGNRPIRKKKNHGAILFWWLLMFVVVGGIVAEYRGPYRGWMKPTWDKAMAWLDVQLQKMNMPARPKKHPEKSQKVATAEQPAGTSERIDPQLLPPLMSVVHSASVLNLMRRGQISPVETRLQYDPTALDLDREVKQAVNQSKTATQPVQQTQIVEKDATTEKIHPQPVPGVFAGNDKYHKLARQFYEEELRKLFLPQLGQTYRVIKMSGRTITGTLKQIIKNEAILELSPGTTVKFSYNQIAQPSRKELFPELYAREVALRKVREIRLKEKVQEQAVVIRDERERERANRQPASPPPEVKSTTAETSRLTKYDPTDAQTPPSLKPLVQGFATWLTYQNRHVGGN
ncbi:MAG: hypothetical protein D6820_12090, partial [Lentisphaerae bacterium]